MGKYVEIASWRACLLFFFFFEWDHRGKWGCKNEMGFAVARFKFECINVVTCNFA